MLIAYECENEACPNQGVKRRLKQNEEAVCKQCGWMMVGNDG